MGHGWESKPRARSSCAAQLKSACSAGRREGSAAGGASAAREALAVGGSAPLVASDLLAGPAHSGAHAAVEGSLAGSQVCFRLLLRASLRGGPVTCASVLLCAPSCSLTGAPNPLFQRQGADAGSGSAEGLLQRTRGGGWTRVSRAGRVPCRTCPRKRWLPPPRSAERKPFQLTFRRVLVLDACGSDFRHPAF
jgi:hypothetical protein